MWLFWECTENDPYHYIYRYGVMKWPISWYISLGWMEILSISHNPSQWLLWPQPSWSPLPIPGSEASALTTKPAVTGCSVSPQNLNVLTQGGGVNESQPLPSKVLDIDTISQVKEKLLEQVYKGTTYSQRPHVDSLDLGEDPCSHSLTSPHLIPFTGPSLSDWLCFRMAVWRGRSPHPIGRRPHVRCPGQLETPEHTPTLQGLCASLWCTAHTCLSVNA